MRRYIAALLAGLAACAPARAADISVGLAAAASSADPHFHELTPNNALARHIFGALLRTDTQLQPRPDLAASWPLLDDRSWNVTLRPDVKLHHGTKCPAQDVGF